jgi:L-lactate dehydrogenase complex protein LldG
MDARTEVLRRVRDALGPDVTVPVVRREYRGAGADAGDGAVERFCERVAEYRASVRRIAHGDLEATLVELCAGLRAGVPGGLLDGLPGAEVVLDDPPLPNLELDRLDLVITGCALAIADTGTIVLDGGPRSGRRTLSLIPDRHVCLVESADIVPSVPDAIERLAATAAAGLPLTFVSGPSATSDIELERVEGVHGPRTLDVVVIDR